MSSCTRHISVSQLPFVKRDLFYDNGNDTGCEIKACWIKLRAERKEPENRRNPLWNWKGIQMNQTMIKTNLCNHMKQHKMRWNDGNSLTRITSADKWLTQTWACSGSTPVCCHPGMWETWILWVQFPEFFLPPSASFINPGIFETKPRSSPGFHFLIMWMELCP